LPGTPAWWTAQKAAATTEPGRGRGRPRRSFDEIVAAGAELVDELGPTGVNMRLLADRLGTSTATLYRHVSGKEELFVHVVDRLLGEVRAGEGAEGGDWREVLTGVAFGYQRFLTEHPNVLPLLVGQLPIGPNSLLIRERSLAALIDCGFSEELAARSFTTLLQFVVGWAVTQGGDPTGDETEDITAYYRSLSAETYPHVAAAADALTETPSGDGFTAGLEIVLDGIERARPTKTRRARQR
jgi:AcrR family transcriptional regulator